MARTSSHVTISRPWLLAAGVLSATVLTVAGCSQTTAGSATGLPTSTVTASLTTAPGTTPGPTVEGQPPTGPLAAADPCSLGDPAVLSRLGLTPQGADSPERGQSQCLFSHRVDSSYAGVLVDTTRPYSNFATPSAVKQVVESVVDGRATATVTSTGTDVCIVAVDFGGSQVLATQVDMNDTPLDQDCDTARQLAQFAAAQVPPA